MVAISVWSAFSRSAASVILLSASTFAIAIEEKSALIIARLKLAKNGCSAFLWSACLPDRLAGTILQLRFPCSLHQLDYRSRHGNVIQFRGHGAAFLVSPVKKFQ